MKLTFFSNFLNHHQLPLCKEFIKHVGDQNFHFVSSERIHEERAKMGYEDMNVKYPFVVRSYESKEQMDEAIRLAHDSDVVIMGTTFRPVLEIRAKENKLTLLFQERMFKNGTWHRFIPTTACTIYKTSIKYRKNNLYILCASAYAADDYSLCGFPRSKCLKWGYFPEVLPKPEKSFDKLRIMWCGRMLWWKHPEDAIEVARMIFERNVDFEMKVIGSGEKREKVEKMIDKYGLRRYITTYNFMAPSEIRKVMNESNVYLFTSGKQEGWGVVLNEALNSGCAVIANKNAGSSPYLIKDNENGILYDGTKKSLKEAVDKLLSSSISSLSEEANSTIVETWNPSNAVDRLFNFIKSGSFPHDSGPCSMA